VTFGAERSWWITKLFTADALLQRHLVLLAAFPEEAIIEIEHRQRF
jgi:hypothetical protein